jgi:hypothetical protein
MPLIETSLAVISVLSFALALFESWRNQILKVREKANVELVKQQLTSLLNGLESALHCVDAIVQIPKQREATIVELQDLARIARGQLFVLLRGFKDSRVQIDAWQFGQLLRSQNFTGLINMEEVYKHDEMGDSPVTREAGLTKTESS